jgi:glycosyltransferase involved in cell wall biosynthesis
MISIVLATFNRAATLMRAVDSVLQQTVDDWELIIVDDGSTDESRALLDAVEEPRIRVVRHEKNRGVTAAKNSGLGEIRGEWFTLLDSDDEMTPDALEVMLECAERTGATAITCNCRDAITGKLWGTSFTHDGWLSAAQASQAHGEHWGLTQTELLGGLRFDERIPGFEGIVWTKINRVARRYYLHRALLIVHTEGADRVCVKARDRSVWDSFRVFAALGDDADYLRALKELDPRGYRRRMVRIWPSRIVRPLLPRRDRVPR